MADDNQALLLQMSADLNQLSKALKKGESDLNKSCDAMERRALQTEKKLAEAFGGGNLKAAFNTTALTATNRVMEEGAAKAGILGGALQSMGGYGLVAAGALAAVGGALEEGKKTAEWAEQLVRTSKALGLTTTQVQEFDHVFTSLGVDVDKGNESLGGLSRTIGLVEAGGARAQSVKFFTDALKITPEQLRGWGTLEQQLPHILDAMGRLNSQELSGFATRLKVDPGVLASLVEGRDKIADLVDEAHRLGIVVDADVVKKYAEAADKMRVASEVIQKNLTVAFGGVAVAIGSASTALVHFIQLLENIPQGRLQAFEKYAAIAALGGGQAAFGAAYDDVDKRRNPSRLGAAFGAAAGEAFPDHNPPPTNLIDPTGKHRHALANHTGELAKTAEDDLETALKAEAEAQKALTGDVWKRAEFEQQALADETAIVKAKLAKDLETLLKDKSIDAATRALLEAKLAQAQAAQDAAAAAKSEKIDRDALDAANAEALQLQREVNDQLSQVAEIQASLATSPRERNQLQNANLSANQALDRRALQDEIDRKVRDAGGLGTSAGDAEAGFGDQRMKALTDLQAAQRAQLARSQQNPLQQFATANAPGELGTKLQGDAAQAIDTLDNGLAEVILKGKSLKEVLLNAFEGFAQNALKQGLDSMWGSLFSAGGSQPGGGSFMSSLGAFTSIFKLFGFAAGTGPGGAPGGLAIVGEHGPEVANVPKGTQISPNSSLRALLNGPSLKSAPAHLLVSVANSYDMRGNSGDRTIQGWIAASEARTKAGAFAAVQAALPGMSLQQQYEAG